MFFVVQQSNEGTQKAASVWSNRKYKIQDGGIVPYQTEVGPTI
jgi:hypothetical protein